MLHANSRSDILTHWADMDMRGVLHRRAAAGACLSRGRDHDDESSRAQINGIQSHAYGQALRGLFKRVCLHM